MESTCTGELWMVSYLPGSAGMIVNVAPAHVHAMQAASVTRIDSVSACLSGRRLNVTPNMSLTVFLLECGHEKA